MSLRTELEGLYQANGGALTKRAVVDHARAHPQSAIHGYVFHLGTAEAAERYYLSRAGQLIRRFRVRHHPQVDQVVLERLRPREYHSVPRQDGGREYRNVEDIAADPRLTQITLDQARFEWQRLKARYEHLDEFFDMIREDLEEEAA